MFVIVVFDNVESYIIMAVVCELLLTVKYSDNPLFSSTV